MDRAASLGLSLAELKQLDKRTNDFDQSIKKIDLDIRKELDAAEKGKRKADPVALRRLDAQRYLAIVSVIQQVKTDLSPASWARLKAFVNDRYRHGVRVIEVKK